MPDPDGVGTAGLRADWLHELQVAWKDLTPEQLTEVMAVIRRSRER